MMHLLHITMSMSDNYIPEAKINLIRVLTYVGFIQRSFITYYQVYSQSTLDSFKGSRVRLEISALLTENDFSLVYAMFINLTTAHS